ncbi:MAG: thioredoxin family protein [Deferrisomatales bacterium]|nr:thioredoxin family protein [Deferrisomatales bacterium]
MRPTKLAAAAALLLALAAAAGCRTEGGPQAGPSTAPEIGRPTVLVFGLGPRCRYCVELKEEIGRVTEQTGDAVIFRDIRVDRDTAEVRAYRVVLSPTLVFLDAGGVEVSRHQGLLDARQLLERLADLGFWPRRG